MEVLNKPYFELVSEYKEDSSLIPQRSTKYSAGYDFYVAKDIVIPSISRLNKLTLDDSTFSLEEIEHLTKILKTRPTLVPTGVKAYMPKCYFLQLSVRSSCPLKSWLILANGVGIIDADYYNNPDNEGHIFFQIINLFPRDILLNKGDRIGQGIFIPYVTTSNDNATTDRIGGFGSTNK